MGRLTARVIAAVLVLTAFAPAVSGAGEGHDKARRLKDAGEILPLETVINTATAQKPGRVIEAELKKRGGGYIYEIELVDKAGVVWELEYDASTGNLLSSKTED